MASMDEVHNAQPLWQWSSRYTIAAGLLAIAALLFVSSMVLLMKTIQIDTPIEFISREESSSASARFVWVDVRGAVVHPGVYQVPEGSRVEDVLRLAGQLRQDAAITWVDQQLNRAAKLADGMKIFIPTVKEIETSHNGSMSVGDRLTSHNIDTPLVEQPPEQVQFISINNASAAELESLSGIGPVTAQAIISGRPYQSVQELLDKKVVKPSVFEKNKSRLSL